MKKILLILCVLLCVPQSFGVTFGCELEKCSIADAPADAITEYLADLTKVINNVSRVARSQASAGTLGKVKSQTLRITNATAGLGGYFSSFDYYVAYPISHDIPYQIERDHKLLLNQSSRLLSIIQSTLKSGGGNVIIENACEGINDSKCSFNGQTAENILSAVFKNHKKIIYYYQLNVIGKSVKFKDTLILVDDDFTGDISKHYGPSSVKDCSACEDGFEGRINKSIDEISDINKNSESAVNKWKYAWAVLTGNEQSAEGFLTRGEENQRTDYYSESLGLGEENVLKRYLGETGAGARTSEVVLDNLKRYNENAAAVDENGNKINNGKLNTSNPLENTVRNTFSDSEADGSIASQIDLFNETIIQSYEESKKQGLDPSYFNVPTTELEEIESKIEITQDIKQDIDGLYKNLSSFSITQDTGVGKLQAKMIQMHYNLSNAINTLDEITSVSEEVCNAQGKGLGLCSYR